MEIPQPQILKEIAALAEEDLKAKSDILGALVADPSAGLQLASETVGGDPEKLTFFLAYLARELAAFTASKGQQEEFENFMAERVIRAQLQHRLGDKAQVKVIEFKKKS
jgi:hypothetical protein